MIPISATKTKVENEVYRHKNATDEEFAAINAFYKQVLDEDKMLCNGSQRNLNAGVFTNGELHPEKEGVSCTSLAILKKNVHANADLLDKGPIYFQNTVKSQVMAHRRKELAQDGVEIWPATPRVNGEVPGKLREEERFCSELEAAACRSNAQLAW